MFEEITLKSWALQGFKQSAGRKSDLFTIIIIIIIIIINSLTARVVGAPQMILQPVFSIYPCSPLPSGTCRTPGLSILRCCLPTSSSLCLVFFALSLCLAVWFWPWWTGNMTIPLQFASLYDGQEVFVRLNCLLDLGTDFLVGNMRCVVSCGSTSFPWFVFFFGALLWGSRISKHTERWMWQGSASVVSWSWERYSCQSKLVSALSMLLLSVLFWRVSQAWNPRQL